MAGRDYSWERSLKGIWISIDLSRRHLAASLSWSH